MRIAAIAACAALLVGCSPGIAGFIGVVKSGEDYRVLVAMCDGDSVDYVEIRDRGAVNAQNEYAVIESLRVLRVGKVLASDLITADRVADRFTPNGRYMMSGRAPGWFPSVISGPVFNRERLLALADGEILTKEPGTWDVVVVAGLDEFTELIEAEWCELEPE